MSILEDFLEKYTQLAPTERLEIIQVLCLLLDESQLQSLTKTLASLPKPDRDLQAEQFVKVLQEPTFQSIVRHTAEITNEPNVENEKDVIRTRENTLLRIKQFIKSSLKHDDKRTFAQTNAPFLSPILNKYDMVFVDFTGLGSEMNEQHYAIIWDVEVNRDNLVVIPCKSFKDHKSVNRDSSFDVAARFPCRENGEALSFSLAEEFMLDCRMLDRRQMTITRGEKESRKTS